MEIDSKSQPWLVSTATVVDGIMKLITTNSKRDSNRMNSYPKNERRRNELEMDRSPLRSFYLEENDLFIYKTVVNFFNAVSKSYKITRAQVPYIYKTVGIQALFAVLRILLADVLKKDKNISVEYFENFLTKASHVNFSDNFFTASGIGKSRIQNTILLSLGLKDLNTISNQKDIIEYKRVLQM